MKKHAAFLTGLLMLTSMTACSSQDDTSSQGEKGTTTAATTAAAAESETKGDSDSELANAQGESGQTESTDAAERCSA